MFNSFRLNKFNLICSDMAPNTSGTRSMNHINIMNLAESVFLFSENFETNPSCFFFQQCGTRQNTSNQNSHPNEIYRPLV